MQKRRSVVGLELGVVEGGGEAASLDPAADDDQVSLMEPSLYVPPPEPRRLDLAGLVTEVSDRPLNAAPESRLHP